jgi:hypothetical protein
LGRWWDSRAGNGLGVGGELADQDGAIDTVTRGSEQDDSQDRPHGNAPRTAIEKPTTNAAGDDVPKAIDQVLAYLMAKYPK